MKLTAVLSAELKIHMFVYVLVMIALRIYRAWSTETAETVKDSFAFSVVLFCVIFCVLQHLFELFVNDRIAAFLSVLPGVLLFFALRNIGDFESLGTAVILAVALRLVFGLISFADKILLFGSFALTFFSIYLEFSVSSFSGRNKQEILMFVCLSVLVLSAAQAFLFDRGKEPFPFIFFIIVGILISFIPVKDKPIDWTPVVALGERIVQGADNAIDSVSYYVSQLWDKEGYSAGYSSLDNVGGSTSDAGKTELILTTSELPYVPFTDRDTDKVMLRRRAVYLQGGAGVDKENLVAFLKMLKDRQVTRDMAQLFLKQSDVNIEYAYIKTSDEITPRGSLKLTGDGRDIVSGKSSFAHKKGYMIKARYLDIDFGSPYLTDILREASEDPGAGQCSYDELGDYAEDICGIYLGDIISEQEYNSLGQSSFDAELDTEGCSERMRNLAQEFAAGYDNEYDRCRAIEQYLRQYPYSRVISDKYGRADMTTAGGMSALADTFLFEEGRGYCIHYTSAMVMLLRLSGIPARTGFGFCYLYPFEQRSEYEVSGDRAHAWPEAYIEGIGWVPFEPTGSYPNAGELTWNRAVYEAAEGEAGYDLPDRPELEGTPELADALEEDALTEDKEQSRRLLYIALIVVISALVLLALIIAGAKLARAIRYRIGSDEEKFRMDVETVKKAIRKHSDEEFYDRGLMSDYIRIAPKELEEELQKLFRVYYRLEYGAGPESDRESGPAPAITRADIELAKNLANNGIRCHYSAFGQNRCKKASIFPQK